MSELQLLQELSGNTYKIYRYLCLKANENGVIWGITIQSMIDDLKIGYTTVYACVRELKEKNYINWNGAKHYAKILPL